MKRARITYLIALPATVLVLAGVAYATVTGAANTREDYLATIGGGVDFVTLKPIEPISVRVHGDSAAARLKLKFKVVAGGQTVQHEGWTTDLFERRDGRWQVVWSQSTAVPNNLGLFIQSLQL